MGMPLYLPWNVIYYMDKFQGGHCVPKLLVQQTPGFYALNVNSVQFVMGGCMGDCSECLRKDIFSSHRATPSESLSPQILYAAILTDSSAFATAMPVPRAYLNLANLFPFHVMAQEDAIW